MSISTRNVRVSDILTPPRIRKGIGEIDALAEDIRSRGLINPVTVMDRGDGSLLLIAGMRRLEAVKRNGGLIIRASVLSPMDADELLAMEFAENEQRQDFSVSERLEYAEKIKAVEQAKARERMAKCARERKTEAPIERSYPQLGETRHIVAKKSGFSSGIQFERAAAVAAKQPDLLEKIDKGETTIYGAYCEIKRKELEALPGKLETSPEAQTQSGPHQSIYQAPVDRVARAKHERLLKNPIYAELTANHQEAVREANRAKGELRFQVEGFEKVIRGHEENINYMRRMMERLRAENAELRRRLGLSETEPVIITQNDII